MKVSILIPTYNRSEFLEKTLTSVFSQTHEPHEVILIDDGSTDDTVSRLDLFRKKNPRWSSKLVYTYIENSGKSSALNTGLHHATGEWIAYNDSDDQWVPEKIQEQFEALRKYPDCRVCFSDCIQCSDAQNHGTEFTDVGFSPASATGKLEDTLLYASKIDNGIRMQTLLIRNDIQEKIGTFNPAYRIAQDADLVFRLATATEFCYVTRPLVLLDRNPNVANRLTRIEDQSSIQRRLNHVNMLRDWLKTPANRRQDVRQGIQRQIRDNCSMLANLYNAQGNKKEARQAILSGMQNGFDIKLTTKLLLSYIHQTKHKRS